MSPLSYGFHSTPFGECLIALSGQSVCHLSFVDHGHEQARALLHKEWPQEMFIHAQKIIEPVVTAIFTKKSCQMHIHLKGTPFQIKTWDFLLSLKRGTTISYQDVARAIGQPTAVRAVASAIARNTIAVIVPCHRVISSTGNIHKYRWGTKRKKALLTWEKESLC